MTLATKTLLGLAAIAITAAAIFVSVRNKTREDATPQTPAPPQAAVPEPRGKKVSLLGWIPYWDQTDAFQSFKDHADLFSYVSVFWYELGPAGDIKPYTTAVEDTAIVDFAHAHDVKVLAVVANLPDYTEGGDWDPVRAGNVIHGKNARASHVTDLVALAEEHGFDGINIDYEALPGSMRSDFTAFITELGAALHARGKLLGVAIHPKTSETNPRENNGSHAQDWKALYSVVDQMYFMTYSEHSKGSAPGPNADPAWMDRVLAYAVRTIGVPHEKIFLGVPLYGQAWVRSPNGSTRGIDDDVTFFESIAESARFGATPQWDENTKTPYLTYQASDGTHVLWYEDHRSLSAKLPLLEKYGISNAAFWRLGGEDPEVWDILETLGVRQ